MSCICLKKPESRPSLIKDIIRSRSLIKIFEPEFTNKFKNFLEKGWYILGNEVIQFEKSFADYNESKYCIGVANGLDAIEILL